MLGCEGLGRSKRQKKQENTENNRLIRHFSIVTYPVSSAPRSSLNMLCK